MSSIELYFFKLRTGEQVLAVLGGISTDEEDDPRSVLMLDPVVFKIIPEKGPWMQHYLNLAEEKQIQLDMDDIMFAVPASQHAHKYYNRFFEMFEGDRVTDNDRHPSGDDPSDHEWEEEYDEETLQAILESSKAIKH